jgi:hypothetical protein
MHKNFELHTGKTVWSSLRRRVVNEETAFSSRGNALMRLRHKSLLWQEALRGWNYQ